MKRHSGVETNSLEMLLDTMCNTFGGICFIAFLVCIILSMLPKNTDETNDEAQVVEMERMLVDKETDRLVRMRDDLKARTEIKKEFIASNENAIVSIDVPTNLQSNKLEIARLKKERVELEDALAKITTQCEYSKREAARLERILKELQAKLDEPFKFPKRTVRTPMERTIENLRTTDIVIYKHKFYELHNESQVKSEDGPLQNGKKTWIYTLIQDKGVLISDDFCSSNRLYKRLLSNLNSKTYMRIFCDVVSFQELCIIRDDLIKNKKMYNWHINNESSIGFIEGYDGRVQ